MHTSSSFIVSISFTGCDFTVSKFQVRLFYDKDLKNYHMNPVKTRKVLPVYVSAEVFLQLVENGLVYTR